MRSGKLVKKPTQTASIGSHVDATPLMKCSEFPYFTIYPVQIKTSYQFKQAKFLIYFYDIRLLHCDCYDQNLV